LPCDAAALIFQCYLLLALKIARENIINALITMQRKPRAEANPRGSRSCASWIGRQGEPPAPRRSSFAVLVCA